MTSLKLSDSFDSHQTNKYGIIAIVYLAFFLDNMLLTVVVPIIPDFLHTINIKLIPKSAFYDNIESLLISPEKPTLELNTTKIPQGKNISTISNDRLMLKMDAGKTMIGEGLKKANSDVTFINRGKSFTEEDNEEIERENGPVGVLLSSKALVQLFLNPVIGIWTSKVGYKIPIFFGSINLLLASILFAYGQSYLSMLVARSVQGVSSACIGVAGMSLAAATLGSADTARPKVMGALLGGGALGVLLGYPIGGLLYHFCGKSAPFLLIAGMVLAMLVLQLVFLDLNTSYEAIEPNTNTAWWPLLTDGVIIVVTGAIFISTSAMAILEPCLPIWLMTHLKPEKWQVGTVFIPDSLGYLLGTNLFGVIACKVGQWKVSVIALLTIGIAAIMIPTATSLGQLLLPHFSLGLGIGALDAALVPQLATLVDSRHTACYGAVFSLQQTAVSLAYSVAPLVGGALAHGVGFGWTLRGLGLLNLLYSPLLAYLAWKLNSSIQRSRLMDSSSDCDSLNQAITLATYGTVYE